MGHAAELDPDLSTADPAERRPRATSWVHVVWLALIYLVAAAPLVNVLAVPQDFDRPSGPRISSDEAESMLVLRLRGLAVLGALAGSAAWALASGRARPGGHALCFTGLLFAATPMVSSVLGLEPRWRGTLLVLPAMFLAVYLLPRVKASWLAQHVERIVLFYLYATLVALVVSPSSVIETAYSSGWIPGFGFRLHGLGLHSNGFAPFIVTYFLMRWFVAKEPRGVTVHDVLALVALFFTQAKMAWAMFFMAASLAVAENGRFQLRWLRFPVLGLTILLAVLMTDMRDSAGVLNQIAGVLPATRQSQAFTLTGRTQVWRETLYLWEQNPWFGYGPALWDRDMQERYRDVLGWAPPQAHSQFYQALGESGIVGVVGLLAYLVALVVEALRLGSTHPVAPGFVVMLIARGITEPTLSGNVDGAFVVHFWAATFLVLACKARARSRAREVRP